MILEYKGYIGRVEFIEEQELFHGEIQNIRDVVTFQGKTARELRKALKDSVEVYIEFCKKLGQEPQTPFSGRFALRISPELHKTIFAKAQGESKSLNQWIADQLQKAVGA